MENNNLWKAVVYNSNIKPRTFKNLHFAVNWSNRISLETGKVVEIIIIEKSKHGK